MTLAAVKCVCASFTYTAMKDLLEVTNYMLDLQQIHMYNLGLVLGLNQPRLKDMKASDTFRDDVIAAWLRREDQVNERGVPTWKTLVTALRHPRVNQNGVADKVVEEKCITSKHAADTRTSHVSD